MASNTSQGISTDFVEPRLEAEALFGPAAAAEAPVELVDYRPHPFQAIREAWSYRGLAVTLFWAVFVQLMTRFRLGPTWLVLQTFMSLVGFSLIFGGGIFNLKAPGGMPYFLFVMVGMMGWQLFLQTLMMSTRGFQRVKMLKNFHLPLLWVPIVGSAQGLIRSLLYMSGYVMVVLYLWVARGHLYVQLSPKLLAMSLSGLMLCLIFAWGVGMWTAPLYAWAKDVRYVLRLVTPFWMFLTPVLYPIDHLHGKTRLLAEVNPMSSPIEMIKVGLLGAGSVRVYAAIGSIAGIALVFLSGVWFITRFGHSLANTGGGRFDVVDDDDDEFM
jgi:ABC-type polysaccharide/polyol phosphate export permease